MRILLVNGNTTEAVTETLCTVARKAAGPGTEIAPATGSFGAALISHRAEAAVAEHAVLQAIAAHHEGCDGVLIGVSTDPALAAARALLPLPVVGMTEAALLTACMLGGRFGLVTFNSAAVPLYREVVERHGLASRLAGFGTIDLSFADAYAQREALSEAIIEIAHELIENERAEVLILAGAATAGLPAILQDQVPVPLLDGIVCGVLLTESLVRLGVPTPRKGSYAAPADNTITGLDGPLADLLTKRPG